MPMTAEQHTEAFAIREMVDMLNNRIKRAAKLGVSSEFLLTAVEDDNAYHQTVKVVLSERL